MVRRLPGDGSAAAPVRGQGGTQTGRRRTGTAAAAALAGAAFDGDAESQPATGVTAVDKTHNQKRRKAKDDALATQNPASEVQAQAASLPVGQAAIGPMQDAVRSKKRKKRVDSDKLPDSGARALEQDAAATELPGLATAAAAAKAGSLQETTIGTDYPVQKRSRKRKQQQAARTHGSDFADDGDGPTAIVAELATTATDNSHGAGAEHAAQAAAAVPSHGTEQINKDGGHAGQPSKQRRNDVSVEQPHQQPPAPEPHSDVAQLLAVTESTRAGEGEASAKQPKKRRRRDMPDAPVTQPANAPPPQMASGAAAAAAADQETRTEANGLRAKQPTGRKAQTAELSRTVTNGSHAIPTDGGASAPAAADGEAAAHLTADGRAVRTAGAGVAIHGDGPAWREHAGRSDVRTGRFSESEKQTIRDAVALCADPCLSHRICTTLFNCVHVML